MKFQNFTKIYQIADFLSDYIQKFLGALQLVGFGISSADFKSELQDFCLVLKLYLLQHCSDLCNHLLLPTHFSSATFLWVYLIPVNHHYHLQLFLICWLFTVLKSITAKYALLFFFFLLLFMHNWSYPRYLAFGAFLQLSDSLFSMHAAIAITTCVPTLTLSVIDTYRVSL